MKFNKKVYLTDESKQMETNTKSQTEKNSINNPPPPGIPVNSGTTRSLNEEGAQSGVTRDSVDRDIKGAGASSKNYPKLPKGWLRL